MKDMSQTNIMLLFTGSRPTSYHYLTSPAYWSAIEVITAQVSTKVIRRLKNHMILTAVGHFDICR